MSRLSRWLWKRPGKNFYTFLLYINFDVYQFMDEMFGVAYLYIDENEPLRNKIREMG